MAATSVNRMNRRKDGSEQYSNLGAAGTNMFGCDTADKSFGAEPGTMERARAKVDAGFGFMEKLGIR